MTVNLHTHTARCGHATGTDREYVEEAIAKGLTTLGFADHAPLVFPDGSESFFRVPMAEAEEYMSSLRALKEEYKDRIRILIGFELEYYPRYFKDMKQTALDLGVDFLLLSQHYVSNEESRYMARPTDSDGDLTLYADTVIEAMETGIFSYVAHPDLIRYTGENAALYDSEMRRICQAANRWGLPLEINLLGIRDRRSYPNRRFWEIAAEEACTVVIGSDAHSPDVVADGESEKIALAWIKELGLTYEPCPFVRSPKTGELTKTR